MPVDKSTFARMGTERLRALANEEDAELAHFEADEVLVTALSGDPEFTELVDAYRALTRSF